ncbi:MAG: NAD(P)-binding domain-containing protein [Bacteroidetes bacterium]|nr:NAD(P)-binding domain-containing protein [Bacteroidota bacterium]
MKVGILGSGIVGTTLANGFLKHGYNVKIGTGNLQKLNEWKKQAGDNASTGSFADAASFGDIVVLAVKGSAAKQVVLSAGVENLKGKVIIDTTNPIADLPPSNGVLKFFTDLNESLMEKLQSAFPDISFVKAFNCVGNAFMVEPDFGTIKPTMFICGNDIGSKKQVIGILELFGWEYEDLGSAESARAIEPLCILWCIPGFLENRWSHAFKLLKK